MPGAASRGFATPEVVTVCMKCDVRLPKVQRTAKRGNEGKSYCLGQPHQGLENAEREKGTLKQWHSWWFGSVELKCLAGGGVAGLLRCSLRFAVSPLLLPYRNAFKGRELLLMT